MKYSDNRELYPGLYCSDATELDDIAYELYCDTEFNKSLTTDFDNHWWTQEGFVNRLGMEEKKEYYKQATIIIRNLKINKLQNETKN